MEEHPGVVFRDGPSGRRAALAGGPGVWEVIEAIKGTGATGEKAIAATAAWANLSPAQIGVAVRYYGDFQDEIDARIQRNRDESERQRRAWDRAQKALG